MAASSPAALGQILDKGLPALGSISPEASLSLIVGVTVLSVAPAVLISLTSFTRITIVLAFLRQGLGLPGVPPNQVLAALALFLTLFTMQPTLEEVWTRAGQPYLEGKLAPMAAAAKAVGPVKSFMLRHTRQTDLLLFAKLAGADRPRDAGDLSLITLSASFLLSELKSAFQIGLVILLPFLLIDLAISISVSSLGLAALSPQTLALPLKLALFVGIDGWNLIVGSLVRTIH